MDFVGEGFAEAFRLVTTGDGEVLHAVWVTLLCTTTAVTLAALVAFPVGAWLGIHRRDGRGALVFLMRIGMFTPTVVVGLLVFALLQRRGPLASLDLLYTQGAIVFGEFLLAFPLIVVLVHGSTSVLDRRVHETARTLGAGSFGTLRAVLGEVRVGLVAAYLAGFARCLSELGVVMLVGGNFEMRTRTLASTIALELRRGDFARGLACGILLMVLATGTALVAHHLGRERRT